MDPRRLAISVNHSPPPALPHSFEWGLSRILESSSGNRTTGLRLPNICSVGEKRVEKSFMKMSWLTGHPVKIALKHTHIHTLLRVNLRPGRRSCLTGKCAFCPYVLTAFLVIVDRIHTSQMEEKSFRRHVNSYSTPIYRNTLKLVVRTSWLPFPHPLIDWCIMAKPIFKHQASDCQGQNSRH